MIVIRVSFFLFLLLFISFTNFQDKPGYSVDEFGNSDEEKEPDAYLARVKREAEERDEGEGGTSEDESTDDDFVPGGEASDVAEEYVYLI